MAIAMTLKDYLMEHGVEYEVISHSRTHCSMETAHAARIPENCLAKSVVLEDDDGYLMAVLPANQRVRLGELSGRLNRHLRLANEREFAGLFRDCEIGAIPPIGRAYGVETVMDDGLASMGDIYFEGGDHEDLIHVKRDDFMRLMDGSDTCHFGSRM